MKAPDIKIELNSGWYGRADSQELAERLRTEMALRIESDLFDHYSEGAQVAAPEVILSILYTLLPLREIYVNILSSMLWEAAKSANERHGRGSSRARFVVRKVDEDGRTITIKEVSGLTTDPEIIKDLIRRADE
jgi:hypothetical protein